MLKKIINYFKESKDELKKVVWPTKRETARNTMLVIAISLFVAVFLGLMDIGLNFGLEKLISR